MYMYVYMYKNQHCFQLHLQATKLDQPSRSYGSVIHPGRAGAFFRGSQCHLFWNGRMAVLPSGYVNSLLLKMTQSK